MVKKLISRSAFAKLAGVSPAAVTKACGSSLAAAIVGKRIDPGHVAAIDYVQQHADDKRKPPATGLDPLYEDAVKYCQETGRFTANNISKGLKVGTTRAARIISTMKAAGISSGPELAHAPEPEPTPERVPPCGEAPRPRGHGARKANKKAAAPSEPEFIEIPENIRDFSDMTLQELIYRFGTDERFVDWLRATKSIEDINSKRLANAKTMGELVSRDLVKVGIVEPVDAAHRKLLTDGAKTIARRVTAGHDAGRSVEELEYVVVDLISSFIKPMKETAHFSRQMPRQ